MIPSLAGWVLVQRSARPYKILGDLGSISGVVTLPSTMVDNLLVEWEPLEAGALAKARQEYFNAQRVEVTILGANRLGIAREKTSSTS